LASLYSLWRQTGRALGRLRLRFAYALLLAAVLVPGLLRGSTVAQRVTLSNREVAELLLGNVTDKDQPGWGRSEIFESYTQARPLRLAPVAAEIARRAAREPLGYARLWVKKIGETITDCEIPGNSSYDLSRRQAWLLRAPWSHFALLAGLAAFGAWVAWRAGARLPAAWLLAGLVSTWLLIPDSRTRGPWLPVATLLAGAGLAALLEGERRRALARSGLAAGVLGLVVLAWSWWSAPSTWSRPVDYLNAGLYYLGRNDLGEILRVPASVHKDRRLNAAGADLERARLSVLAIAPPCGTLRPVNPERARSVLIQALGGQYLIHQDQGALAKARADLDGILWLDPGEITALLNSAQNRKYEDQPEQLVEEFQLASILSPDDPRPHEGLAIAFGSINAVRSPTRAQFHLRRLVETAPNHPMAGEYRQSLQKVSTMIAMVRTRVDLDQLRGEAYGHAAAGRIDEALAVFRKLFIVDTSDSSDFEQVAGLYLAKDDLPNALDCFLDAAVLQPTRLDLLEQIADLYQRLGQSGRAHAVLRRAVSLPGAGAGIQEAFGRLDAEFVKRPWAPPGSDTPCGKVPERQPA
jgi:tetratricopeptide (TPR) repeat protein